MMPIIIDIPPSKPRPRDSTSIPIDPAQLPTFFDHGWREDISLFCNDCGHSSYQEEDGQRRQGCKHCGYVTYYPDRHFTVRTSAPHM